VISVELISCPGFSSLSADHLDLFVLSVRTALPQCRAFAVAGPSSWSGLPHLLVYEPGLCLVFLQYLDVLLRRFFFPGASALKGPLTSQYCDRRFITVL